LHSASCLRPRLDADQAAAAWPTAGCARLLWVGKERTTESFEKFFTLIGKELAEKIEFVCSDMWKPCLQLIAKHCTNAVHNPSPNHGRQMRWSSARRSSACARRATFVCDALPSDPPKFLEKILDGLAFGNPFARGLLARCLFARSLQDGRGLGQPYHGDADFIGDDEIARMDRYASAADRNIDGQLLFASRA
jgi:hypothetical protein